MNYVLIPLDLIRFWSVFTALDLICLPVFIFLCITKKLKIEKLTLILVFISLYVFILGFLNINYLIENFKLSIVFLFIFIKLNIIFHFINKYGVKKFIYSNSICFSLVMFIQLICWTLGFGFSNSGRFSGLLGSSNGLAAFSLFSLLFCIFSNKIKFSYLNFIGAFLSVFVGLLTLSKGFIVFLVIIFYFFLARILFKNNVLLLFFVLSCLIMLFFVQNTIGYYLYELFNNFNESYELGLSRIVDFFYILQSAGISSDLDSYRASLNTKSIEFFINNPTFFGYGYDSNIVYVGHQRPHNIFLTALFELGFFFFLMVLITFFIYFYTYLKRLSYVGLLFSMLGLSIMLISLKTPFFYIYTLPWFVFLYQLKRFYE